MKIAFRKTWNGYPVGYVLDFPAESQPRVLATLLTDGTAEQVDGAPAPAPAPAAKVNAPAPSRRGRGRGRRASRS